jgi:hypothetical protein
MSTVRLWREAKCVLVTAIGGFIRTPSSGCKNNRDKRPKNEATGATALVGTLEQAQFVVVLADLPPYEKLADWPRPLGWNFLIPLDRIWLETLNIAQIATYLRRENAT